MNESSRFALLEELATAIRLREGTEGISRALWLLHQHQARSTHEWARSLRIPVPVLSALRRELEKRELLETGVLTLTPHGEETLGTLFGRGESVETRCPACKGKGRILPPELTPALEQLREYCEERPGADVTLDQSHGTPETALRRALLIYDHGLLGRPIAFMGDDDYVSIACMILRSAVFASPDELGVLTVFDLDERYLDTIAAHSDETIETVEYDVRNELPESYHNQYEVTVTDPAYTENGLLAFTRRCAQATGDPGALLLSHPLPDATQWAGIQIGLLQQGWCLREMYPQMNEYIGASVHAHASSAFWLQKFIPDSPENKSEMRYTPFYTADRRPAGGMYECAACATRYVVGPGEEYETIQDLKASSCYECGNDTFTRTGPRRTPNEHES